MTEATTRGPQPVRAAIVGAGRMGVRHIEAFRALGFEVCGVCDRSPDALSSVGNTFGLAAGRLFTDADEMLRVARPDAITIATTAPSHHALTLNAANAGVKHILCEKPMATSIAKCHEMIAACRDAGANLAVNHQMRFLPRYAEIRALIGTEELGPLVSMIVAAGNFGLAMNASHYFEAFRFVSGSEVVALQAWFDEEQVPNPRGPEFVDRAGRVLARNGSGATLFLDFSAAAGHGLHATYVCRNGRVTVDELAGRVTISARLSEHRQQPTTRYAMPAEIRSFDIPPADTVAPTVDVWKAMLDGGSYPDGATGLHTVRCLVAAHLSVENGNREVRIEEADGLSQREFPWA